jgi:hypothetical protein
MCTEPCHDPTANAQGYMHDYHIHNAHSTHAPTPPTQHSIHIGVLVVPLLPHADRQPPFGTTLLVLLPVKRLYFFLGERQSTRRTFPLPRRDALIQAATRQYTMVEWTHFLQKATTMSAAISNLKYRYSLCIHLVITCCLKFCSQQEHLNNFCPGEHDPIRQLNHSPRAYPAPP